MRYLQIKRKIAQMKRATSGYFAAYEGRLIPEQEASALSDRLAESLKCDPVLIRSAVFQYTTYPFSDKSATLFYWQLAANESSLRDGKAFVTYSRISLAGTEEIRFERIDVKDGRVNVKFRVLTGHYAGGTANQSFSISQTNRILYKVGFKAPKYPPPVVLNGLIGLYAIALLKADSVKPIEDIIENDSIIQYNRKNILKLRMKYESCPQQRINPSLRCEKCTVTYEQCPASMRY